MVDRGLRRSLQSFAQLLIPLLKSIQDRRHRLSRAPLYEIDDLMTEIVHIVLR
jgi:hypothetical protein